MPPSEDQLQELIQLQSAQPVQHHETHISHVFLTDRFAYKFKKSVKFEFLDFESLEKRRFACAEEVRLNRRLAPDVYLGVVCIGRSVDGQLKLIDSQSANDREFEPVEWGVKMIRLPDDDRLSELISNDRLTSQQIDSVCGMLIDFYKQLPQEQVSCDDYLDFFYQQILDNRTTLLASCDRLGAESYAQQVRAIHCRLLEFLAFDHQEIASRVDATGQGSRVVDAHGDLRPDHIYLSPHPLAIDCIEFNRDFRTVDLADELSFLGMQCESMGADSIGDQLINRVLAALSDQPSDRLLAFYRCYRACVRSKVAALRCLQTSADPQPGDCDECFAFLELARRHADKLTRPKLIIVRGLMGSGKTTFARFVCGRIGSQHLQTDQVRRELFGTSDQSAGYGEALYTETNRMRVYDEIFKRASESLAAAISVVVDGSFLKEELRSRFAKLADHHHADFLVANCCCPVEVNLHRIAARAKQGTTLSDARPELLEQQRDAEEPIPPATPHLNLDATKTPEAMFDRLVEHVASHWALPLR